MDAKLICLVAFAIIGFASVADSKPTCAEPTCGGTLSPDGTLAAPGEEGGEEGKVDHCAEDPRSGFLNHYAWRIFCKDGTVGATQNPVGKIGAAAVDDAVDAV